jgi:phosphomannomutase/phosphoglucomutase
VDIEIDDSVMSGIAKSFAAYARKKGKTKVLLGHDNRLSSPRFRNVIANALEESGCQVVDLGLVITPMFYFAAHHLDIKAGIMITASHNPAEYNGCKLLLGESTIYGEEIQEIRHIMEQKLYPENIPGGTIIKENISGPYAQMIRGKITLGPYPPKVVIDCGNGTASGFAPEIIRSLGCEVIELFCESDPCFPNHHPDPVNPDNMLHLVAKVQETSADLGIGFDGDGDRLGVVDRQGNMIWGDLLMILFWREILPRYPGTECIVEVKCSQSLADEIRKLGGKPVFYKTGHSLIKDKMKKTGAVFTGEMSGHMFFADDYYGYDDAIYAAARLLQLLSRSKLTITEHLADINKYYSTPEIRVISSDEYKFSIVAEILEHFHNKYPVIDIDGVRVLFPHGWGLVRASNTGPELIVRCEGDSPEALESIKDELFAVLHAAGVKLPF